MKNPIVNVELLGGARNAVVSIQVIEFGTGARVAFTVKPATAVALADKLNALLDDPNEDDTKRILSKVTADDALTAMMKPRRR